MTYLFTIIGLALFETVSSIDNAIINAEVIGTMSAKAKRWFLTWGLFFAVFMVRGLLPWLIIWGVNPSLGPIGSLTATFSGDESVQHSIEQSAPILLIGGGTFLILLFLHWLFMEPKSFGLKAEKFFLEHGLWFYASASIFLCTLIWFAIQINPLMAFGAAVGSSAFFITHGFKQNAEEQEKKLLSQKMTDWSKILYLEIIDLTFSIDGVLGAFAFTLSVPLILLGNGVGALVVRQLTVGNIERVKKYTFLKNGAMYSVLVLGIIMISDSFKVHIPEYVSPLATALIILFFFIKSQRQLKLEKK